MQSLIGASGVSCSLKGDFKPGECVEQLQDVLKICLDVRLMEEQHLLQVDTPTW